MHKDALGYVTIAYLSVLYTIVSILYETNYEPEKQMKPGTFGMNVFLRFVHSFICLYMFLFIVFFYNAKNSHYLAYLTIMFIIVLHWILFECCLLSYYEWTFYKGNVYDRNTKENLVENIFEPISMSILSNNKNPDDTEKNVIFGSIHSLLSIIMVLLVLYKTKLPISMKILFISLIIYLKIITPFDANFKPITFERVQDNVQKYFSWSHLKEKLMLILSNDS